MEIINIDDALIRRCQKGDRQAFAQLIRNYQQMVFNLLYRIAPEGMDIEDIAQEVWLKVYQSISKLQNPKSFRSWLHKIAINSFHDRLRKRGYRETNLSIDDPVKTDKGEELSFEIMDQGLLPEEILLENEVQDILDKAIKRLPEPFREVLVMRDVQHLSYEEITNILDISLGTMKSRLTRAREKIISELSNYIKEKK